MKIENQVTNLIQSKRLFELGIKNKDAQYYWVEFEISSGSEFVLCRPVSQHEERSELAWYMVGEYSKEISEHIDDGPANACGSVYAAFTLSELGQMLNSETYTKRTGSVNSEYPNWEWGDDGREIANCGYKTEVQARCGLLIYHLTYKIVTPQICNDRIL